MKTYSILLVLLSTLLSSVFANNSALPYELDYLYQIYLMEAEYADTRTLATGCKPKDFPNDTPLVCSWREFVNYLFTNEDDKNLGLDGWPSAADKTKDPSVNDLNRLQSKLPNSARVYLDKLFNGLTDRSWAHILERAGSILNTLKKVTPAEQEKVIEAAQKAMEIRNLSVADLKRQVLEEVAGEEAAAYMQYRDGKMDLPETYRGIQEEVDDESITQEKADDIEGKIKTFAVTWGSGTWPNAKPGDVDHAMCVNVLESTVSQQDNNLNQETGTDDENTSDSDHSTVSSSSDELSRCSSEVSVGSHGSHARRSMGSSLVYDTAAHNASIRRRDFERISAPKLVRGKMTIRSRGIKAF